MTDEAQEAIRPRETTPALVDAGYGKTDEPAWQEAGLPFDPAEFAVEGGALKVALEGLESVEVLNHLQAFDTRTTAAAYYERRINELAD